MNTMGAIQLQFSTEEEKLIHVMQLLGDKTRYKLFKLLMFENELCVTEIAAALNISVSAVSQHYKIFEVLGLVDKERVGQKICYLLRSESSLVKDLKAMVNKKLERIHNESTME